MYNYVDIDELIKFANDVVKIPKDQWQRGKIDPTQWSSENKQIQVRDDYDDVNDPAGWMEHERIHQELDNNPEHKDDGLDYPSNNTEMKAYVKQFKFLKNKGYQFEDIFKIPTMEHKIDHKDILKKYWDMA